MSTLESWAESGFLRPHTTSAEEVQNLLGVADRDRHDAAIEDVSLDTRVNLLYRSALVLCDIVLRVHGYRTRQGKSQHEYTLRSLSLTLGATWNDTVDVLNSARVTRNRTDYESVGMATLTDLNELEEVHARLRPAVLEFVRARGYRVG